ALPVKATAAKANAPAALKRVFLTWRLLLMRLIHKQEIAAIRSPRYLRLPGSEPARLIDDVAQRFAGGEAPCVVAQHLEPALVEIGPMAGGVRGDHDARHRPQRMV